jgi:hypothetical protein
MIRNREMLLWPFFLARAPKIGHRSTPHSKISKRPRPLFRPRSVAVRNGRHVCAKDHPLGTGLTGHQGACISIHLPEVVRSCCLRRIGTTEHSVCPSSVLQREDTFRMESRHSSPQPVSFPELLASRFESSSAWVTSLVRSIPRMSPKNFKLRHCLILRFANSRRILLTRC